MGFATLRVDQWTYGYFVTVCMLLNSGKTVMTLELSQVIELWLEECRNCKVEQREENERREQEWKEAEACREKE